jgi:hypothetical protein
MAIRLLAFLVFIALATLTSCSKTEPPKGATPDSVTTVSFGGAEPKTTNPSCSIESAKEIKLGEQELRIWTLKASRLKQLTARLLIANDGQVQTPNEVTYTWPAWNAQPPVASGVLVLLIQNGKAFGAKGKLLPQISLNIEGSPSNAMSEKKSDLFLEGEFHSRATNSSYGSQLGQKVVIYSQLFLPKVDTPGSHSLSSDVESVTAASKNGGRVIAVALEWAPQ